MKKVPLPEWCVSVKKAMVERDDIRTHWREHGRSFWDCVAASSRNPFCLI